MEESTAMTPAPESTPAAIPPARGLDSGGNVEQTSAPQPAASRWGLDETGEVSELPSAKPFTSALTTDRLGSTLDSYGNITDEFVASLAEKAQEKASMPASLSKYGDVDMISETLDLVEDMYSPDGTGVLTALKAVQDRDPSTAQRIFNLCIAANPALAIAQLQAMNYLPPYSEPIENQIPRDLVGAIPPELQQISREIHPDTLYEWANLGEDALTYHLTQQKELADFRREEITKANAQWEQSVTQAKAAGAQQLQELHDRYTEAHMAQLNRWKPTPNEDTNQIMRKAVFAGALDTLLSDPKWLEIQQQMAICYGDAPTWRLFGEIMQADIYERHARAVAMRFNTRLGQIMKDMILNPNYGLNSVFQKAATKAEPKQAPDPEPAKFDTSGNINPDWAVWIYRQQNKTQAKGA